MHLGLGLRRGTATATGAPVMTDPLAFLPRASRAGGFIDVTSYVTSRGVDFDASDIRVGSKLRLTFRGVDHVVYVVPCPDGKPECWYRRGWGRYIYNGERHKSLTSIARLIAGPSDPRVSGNRLFALRRRRRSQ